MTRTSGLIHMDMETEGLAPHLCHLRQESSSVVSWILPEDAEEPVPLGWESYPGLKEGWDD